MRSHIERLDKLMVGQGCGTRSEVRAILRQDHVMVNGQIERDGGRHVHPTADEVFVDGERLITSPAPIVMMNKPAGLLTAAGDRFHSTVIDILPDKYRSRRLMPVGRLDLDTTGLLLFTDDGELTHRILRPQRNIMKVYRARLDMPITPEDVFAFEEGVVFDRYKALPASLSQDGNDASCALVAVHEGKFHQVKKMFEAVGKHVLSLERIAIGPIKLDLLLKSGACRALTQSEEYELRQAVDCPRSDWLEKGAGQAAVV